MWTKIAAVFNLVVILFWLFQWGSFADILFSSPQMVDCISR